MLKSAIGILTYRRAHALKTMMEGIQQHCPVYASAISEDCGQRDATMDLLSAGRTKVLRPEMLAHEYVNESWAENVSYPNTQVFAGTRNLGVAGNSNRLLKWFAEGDWDHLCLCNDDLHVNGDFVKSYAQAHEDLGVGMFCFTDFDYDQSYRYTVYPYRGYKVKFMNRITGIMISITRELFDKIGYFDASFRIFGNEHVDFTHRARQAGGIQLEGQDMLCLDIVSDTLKHQDVKTSVVGATRARADQEGVAIMQECSASYSNKHYYRPYRLQKPKWAGAYGGTGIAVNRLEEMGYQLVPEMACS